ncbi:MAG: tetratricopeptide repeat protein [Victivallaceae bacterium]|nr:tetratricopeptide repeat protein [Victivallaceae bacterium]
MKKYLLPAFLMVCLFIPALTVRLAADDSNDNEAEEFSPWAAWRKGFSYYEEGERCRDKGEHRQALASYKKALQCYLGVKKARPAWNQQIIGSRIKMCEREIKRLDGQLGTTSAVSTESRAEPTGTINAELQSTKAELLDYKKKLFSALIELNELRQRNKQQKNTADRIEDLMREKRILNEEYQLLQEKFINLQKQKNTPDENAQRLRNQLVDIKIKNQMLTQRLKLQQEKEKDANEEIASLYRYKNQAKKRLQELDDTIRNLQYKIDKAKQFEAEEARKLQTAEGKTRNLETHNKQLAANLKEKENEIEKLNGWLEQLRKKSGSQDAVQQEIVKNNQLINKKYKELQVQNEKDVREIQQLSALLRENNVAGVQLKKTLQEVNHQRETVQKEYEVLRKSYDQLLLVQEESAKEVKMLRSQQATAEKLVKEYREKYEWTKKRLAERSDSDLQNITSLNKQLRQAGREADKKTLTNKKLSSKLDELKTKYNKLEAAYSTVKKSSQELQASAKLLAQETENSRILKQENSRLRRECEQLRAHNAKVETRNRNELQDKINQNEEKILALQKRNREISDENRKLSLAANDAVQLQEQLRRANQAIQILRNVGSKKVVPAAKGRAAALRYTPQVTTPQQPVDLKKLLADGRKAEKEDSEEVAIWNYRKYLAAKPQDAEVNRRLGAILFKRSQTQEAAELLRKAYDLTPDNADSAAAYAQLLLKQKDFSKACAILQKAVTRHSGSYVLLTEYANAQAGIGKTAAALDNLAAAIKLFPNKPQAYLTRAQIVAIYHPDRLDFAAQSYRQARRCGAKPDVFLEEILAKKLADNSEMIQFLQQPAEEAERSKDWVSAAWYFGQLHKLRPAQIEYRDKLAAALLLQNEYAKSLAVLDLKNLSNSGRLIAAAAELCRGNCLSAGKYLENAQPPEAMKAYFDALKSYLKTAAAQAPNRQKEFTALYNRLAKLL